MIRIIISDEFGQHGLDIRTAIINGYGSDITDQIQIIGGWNAAFVDARDNTNVIALIRSTAGIVSYLPNAQSIYPRVQTFLPMGSNTFAELNLFTTNEPPVVVTCGAGDEELRNNTAYGKGLEFWDQDLSTPTPVDDQSSFSNGYVLGKLLKIKDTLNCTWWEARYRAREKADRNEPNRVTSSWDLYNGYGKINVDAAVAYVGLIPSDPYVESMLQDTVDQLTIDNAALQASVDQLTIDNAALQASVDQLTIDNAALTVDNAALTVENARLQEFEYTSGIVGITFEKETKFGTSSALRLGKISVDDAKVTVDLEHCIDANSLDKEPLETVKDTFNNSVVKDFIYSKYCEAKEIDLSNLIT